jgi:hypothetical protein
MVDDPEIIGAARLLIDRHGDYASSWAAQRADEDLARDDIAGVTMWHAIGRTIEELQRGRRADEPLN